MEDRRSRATLGCALMLFSPILLTAALILSNTSRDMMTNVEVAWTYIFASMGAITFLVGGAIWSRNR